MTTTVRTKATRAVAAIAAVGALALGADAITSGDSSSASTGPAGAPSAQAGRRPDMGTQVSGTTLAKLKALVLARYDGASVERATELDDGSYVVHVVKSDGSEVHVTVSSAFKITGTETGGPPNGGTPPSA